MTASTHKSTFLQCFFSKPGFCLEILDTEIISEEQLLEWMKLHFEVEVHKVVFSLLSENSYTGIKRFYTDCKFTLEKCAVLIML